MSGQPIDIRPDHGVMVRDILVARLPKGVRVWVFGSRAKWLAKPYSDLDLALEGDGILPDTLISDLKDEFTESDLPWKVDVLDLNAIAPSFRALIDEDRVGFSLGGKVMGEWVNHRLADVIELIGGGTPKRSRSDYWGGDIPWLSVKDFNDDNRYICSAEETITEDGLNNSSTKILKPGQIIISARGTVGVLAQIVRPMAFNQSCYGISANTKFTTNDYIFYLLQNIVPKLQNITHGAVFDTITRDTFQLVDIKLPPLLEQRTIAAILGALDDKIDLNRRMNETLEAMARAIFRDWFVDFGPTRAKMAASGSCEGAKNSQTCTAPYLAPEIWDLFPDRLGEDGVPVGWVVKPIDEIAEFLNGLALQKFPVSDGDDYLPVIKIAELRNGINTKTNKASLEVPKKCVVMDGDFIFSWSGSLMAKFWTCGEGALNQHLFKVSSKDYPAWFYSQWVFHHLAEFQGIAQSKATTMGHIQRGHLKAAKTICPPTDVLERLGSMIEPLVTKATKTDLQSRTLAQTRDLLLPRLMSGEIRVREAEKLAEAAG